MLKSLNSLGGHMSEDKAQKENQGAPAQPKKKKHQEPNNVVQINFNKCLMEDCNSKPKKLNFCDEHYAWYKFGVINKEGKKPKDFDKKLLAFNKFQEKKAA